MASIEQLQAALAASERERVAAVENVQELRLELALARDKAADNAYALDQLLDGLRLLAQAHNSAESFDQMVAVLHHILPFEHAFVLMPDASGVLTATAATHTAFRGTTWRPQRFLQRALEGRTLVSFDVAHVPEWQAVNAPRPPDAALPPTVSALHIPVKLDDATALLVCTHSERGHFTRQQAALAERFSPLMMEALRSTQLLRALRRQRRQLAETVDARTRALTEQRDFALQVLNTMGQGLTVVDAEGRFTYVNPAYAAMIGYAADALLGRSPMEFSAQPSADVLTTALEARRLGETTTYETELLHAEGSRVPVLVTGVPQLSVDGFGGSIAVITDLTQRKATEAALRASEAEARKLSQVASRTDNMVIIADAAGYIEWVNAAFSRVTEYALEEVVGRRPGDLLQGPDSDPETIEYMRRRLRACEPFTAELVNYSKSGRAYWVRVEVQPVRNDRGEVINFIAVESDITEQRAVEQALRDGEERVRLILRHALDAVIIIDAAGLVTEWNLQAEETFGWTEREAVGRRLSELIIPTHMREAHENGMAHYHRTGEGPVLNKRIEIVGVHRDGHEFPVELAISPVRQGDSVRFSAFVRDISRRKAAQRALREAKEAAEAADRAKSEFLANMSHEIRTPMNAVIGLSGLLLDTALSADQRDYVETIRRSGDGLLEIINEILDFSKIEAGRMQLEHVSFDVRRCVEDVLDIFAVQAGEKHLDLAYFIEPEVPPYIFGDRLRVRQVLTNLIGNAVKFTETGEVVVTVQAEPVDATQVQLRFKVRDTGIGIPDERRAQLFRAFSQIDASTTRRYGGTGLGLVISQRLCQLMGGDIAVESEPGIGSTFTAELVVERSEQGEPEVGPIVLDGLRVLIVDDNDTNLQIARHYALAWGMVPETAGSAAEALSLVGSAEPFDIAILDVHMPHVDGLTLALTLNALPATREMPIVILSSTGRSERVQTEARIAAYLNKPLKPNQLADALARAVRLDGTPRSRPMAADTDVLPAQAHPLRILLAEDNVVNQKVAIGMLQRMGYAADVVANGVEALAAVAAGDYDVVLMDIQMPEMDGLEATQRIIARYPAGERPAIIALTAHALEGDRERYLQAGMDDYVSKPIRAAELRAALGRVRRRVSTESASVQDTPPFDMSVLEAQFGADAALMLDELVPIFEQEAGEAYAALTTAAAGDEWETVARMAHKIRGSAGTVGFSEVAALASRLEALAKQEAVDGEKALVVDLGRALERVKRWAAGRSRT